MLYLFNKVIACFNFLKMFFQFMQKECNLFDERNWKTDRTFY